MKFLYFTISTSIFYTQINAHGATSFPPARQWLCSGGAAPNLSVGWNGNNGPNICKSSYQNPTGYDLNTAIVDWAGVNQGAANGRITNPEYARDPRLPHMNAMGGPKSKICSAGKADFHGLDNPLFATDQGGYPNDPTRFPDVYPTPITNGKIDMTYTCSAPHKTLPNGYIDTYITNDGVDVKNKELTWEDLEPVPICHYVPPVYPSGLQKSGVDGNVEYFTCEIPSHKLGSHVLYQVWQRDDSPEAFYSCSDVVISSGNGSPTDPNPTTSESMVTVSTAFQTTEMSTTQEIVTTSQNPKPSEKIGLIDTADHIMNQKKCVSRENNNQLKLRDLSFCQDASQKNLVSWTTFTRNLIQLKDSSSSENLCWEIINPGHKLTLQTYPIQLTACDQSQQESYFKFDTLSGKLQAFMDDRYCVGVDVNDFVILSTCSGVEQDEFDSQMLWFGE